MNKKALIIDDGHGKNTLDKSSPIFLVETKIGDKTIPAGGRFRENTFNMAVADYLNDIAKENGIPTALTAPEHEDIVLVERAKRQQQAFFIFKKQGLFPISISIHANDHLPNGERIFNSANGIETFYKQAYDNQPSDWHRQSKELAFFVQHQALKVRNQRNRRVEPANFYVLRNFHGPAVLFESGFMTNTKELEYLASIQYQKEIAEALFDGIINFYKSIFI